MCEQPGLLGATYDVEADAYYLCLVPEIAAGAAVCQVPVDGIERGEVILDLDANGGLLGVEVLGASALLSQSLLAVARRIG
ncbi:DUF2283 domain-containing protein [Actinokineospora sp. HUAS TT18]|uniref:DUF2283 domain-containing protein n=1 Tax=Actinokineospora sp. HUAS TT18 TaxID=3447451 RepID=UPI003F5276F9